MFVRAFVLHALTLYIFDYLSFLTIVPCVACQDNESLSEMPLGGFLYFPDILRQTISSTVYKAHIHGANKSDESVLQPPLCSAF